MRPLSIVAAESIAGYFEGVVEDALETRGVEASQSATRYLVGVLAEPHIEPRPLALSLQEALVTLEPAERFERLRLLGDAVLYASGFFADHFAARGLETRYVVSIGSRAYGSAGAMLQSDETGLFNELAARFEQFSSVLNVVAERTLAQQPGAKNLLKLYERWLKTGSSTMAEALVEHGIFPTRPIKGVQ
jgi:hypothetical protein